MEVSLEIVTSHTHAEATHLICSAYSSCVIPMVSHNTGYDILIPKDFEISTVDKVVDYIINMVSKERTNACIKFIIENSDDNNKWEKSIGRFNVSTKTLRDLIREEDARLYAKL